MSYGQHGQRWKFTSFSIQKVARPSGTTLQLAVNSRKFHCCLNLTSGSVNIPALRTVQGQRSFGYTGSKDFNSLPVNLKSIKEYNYFKRETKEHFRNLWCNEY